MGLKIVADSGITRDQVFNCNGTRVKWHQIPERTFISGWEKEVKDFKKPKDRVTLMACANTRVSSHAHHVHSQIIKPSMN